LVINLKDLFPGLPFASMNGIRLNGCVLSPVERTPRVT